VTSLRIVLVYCTYFTGVRYDIRYDSWV